MCQVFVPLACCKDGDVISRDVMNDGGTIIASRNTVMNGYLKTRLSCDRIPYIWLFQPVELLSGYETSYAKKTTSETYKHVVGSIKGILNDLVGGVSVDYQKSVALAEMITGDIKESGYIVRCLSQIRAADEYTYSHSANVAVYSMLIAKWLDLPDHMIQEVVQAGLLHDLGKVKIPDAILNKKGSLTPEEFDVVKKHPQDGYDFIQGIGFLSQSTKDAVLLHHERLDGSGYPRGLSGEAISLAARIVSIADVYDAMTQDRVYKSRMSPFEAFKVFMTMDTAAFDQRIVTAFLTNMATSLVGAKVQFSNGSNGHIVYIPPSDILHPVVQVGSAYVDLSQEGGMGITCLGA